MSELQPPMVEPLPTAPQQPPEVEPTNPQPELPDPKPGQPELSEKLLRLPAIQALMAGSPPALSINIKTAQNQPEATLIAKEKKDLLNSGIGFYRSLSGQIGVLFNQLYVSGEEIRAADAAGQLAQIAPGFDSVGSQTAMAGAANPALTAAPPAGAATPPVPTPPQISSGGGLPGAAKTKLSAARTKNILPGSPTSGPAPGAGQLMRSILKQPV